MERRIRKSFSGLLASELLNRQPGFKRPFLARAQERERERERKKEERRTRTPILVKERKGRRGKKEKKKWEKIDAVYDQSE